jgi:arylesterase / paraoxonase
MLKKIAILFSALVLILGLLGIVTYYESGGFKTITNRFEGKTQKVSGISGVEDITIDQATGIAFLSADDRWASSIKQKPVKGAIYTLNLNDSILHPLSMTADFPQEDFHPHGISFFQTPEGKKLLFVVNHRKECAFVEVFEYKNDSLLHIMSIKGDLMISPNDVVAVGEKEFYFTNDHDEKPSKSRTLRDYLQIGMGNIVHFRNDTMFETSFKGLKYANGINKSADGKKLFLAETTGKRITVFDRDVVTGKLAQSKVIETNTAVDNIELDTEGSLWIGCHPQMLKFMGHSKDEKAFSPSEIIKISFLPNGKFEQKTVYMNDGSEISGSAVGAVYKDKLLIGPVFQGHFMVCKSNADL